MNRMVLLSAIMAVFVLLGITSIVHVMLGADDKILPVDVSMQESPNGMTIKVNVFNYDFQYTFPKIL